MSTTENTPRGVDEEVRPESYTGLVATVLSKVGELKSNLGAIYTVLIVAMIITVGAVLIGRVEVIWALIYTFTVTVLFAGIVALLQLDKK